MKMPRAAACYFARLHHFFLDCGRHVHGVTKHVTGIYCLLELFLERDFVVGKKSQVLTC